MLDDITRLSPKYTGVGTTTFAFSFRIFALTDVYVKLAASSTAGTSTTLTKDTDYTVSANLNTQETTPGGSITLIGSYAGGLTSGQVLVIGSQVPYTQTTQLTNYSKFPPEILNTALDRVVAEVQQIKERQSRTVTVDETDSRSPNTVINELLTARDTAVQKASEATNAATTATTKANEVTNKYNLISPHFTAIDAVYANASNVNTVAGSIAKVNAVGTNIAAVNNVHSNMASVTNVSSNATNINTVAGDRVNIGKVAAVYAKVDILSNYTSAISTVSSNISNVNAVYSNISNVNAVARNETNINAVNSNKSNIDTVSANIADVNAVAGDLANIDAASTHAQTATTKANEATSSAVSANASKEECERIQRELASGMQFKGTVASTEDLPASAEVGDTYYVSSSVIYKAWDGTDWATIGASNTMVQYDADTLESIFVTNNVTYEAASKATVIS